MASQVSGPRRIMTPKTNGGLLPDRRRTLLLIVATVSLGILLTVNVVYRIAFSNLRESLDEQLGQQLEGLADALADGIQPDLATGLIGTDFDPSTYLRIHDLLRTFAEGNRLASVAVLDTLWNDPFADSPDTLSQVVYELLDRQGQWALMSGLSWVSPTFRWGDTYYRSVASPITDLESGRTIAIVRLEVDAGYFGALSGLETLAWWIHGLSTVLAIGLVVLFAWYASRTRKWEAHLMHSEKLIGLGRLAATISHEIRNPLGIIKATAQRLSRTDDAEKQRELLRFIPEEADRLDRILTGYLRIGSPVSTAPVPIAMEEHLRTWVTASSSDDSTGKHRTEIAVAPTGRILANPDTPRQVVINLLNNALDVTPDGETVNVSWGPGDGDVGRLSVADRGPGVPARLRQRVFEPFYTTKVKGSGLGLYAVQMMIEEDGGRVWVDENPGGGAVFHVEWPLAGLGDKDYMGGR